MKANLNYDQYIPTHILFGAGQLNNLHAQPMPGKKALIIISNGKSTRDNGYLACAEEQLHKAGVATEVFDGVAPNPAVKRCRTMALRPMNSRLSYAIPVILWALCLRAIGYRCQTKTLCRFMQNPISKSYLIQAE